MMKMIDLTVSDYVTVYLFLKRDPRQSFKSDRPLKLDHCTSVDQAIAIIGGDISGFIRLLAKTDVKANRKAIYHWRSINKFPANMTWLIETLLNRRGYAPVFKILTQIEPDIGEEMRIDRTSRSKSWLMPRKRKPDVMVEATDTHMFVVVDGVRIAKRGKPDTLRQKHGSRWSRAGKCGMKTICTSSRSATRVQEFTETKNDPEAQIRNRPTGLQVDRRLRWPRHSPGHHRAAGRQDPLSGWPQNRRRQR